MQASQMGTNDNAYSLALISLRVHNIEPQQLAVYKLYDKLVNSTRIQEVKGVNLKLFSRLFAALVHTDWPMHFLIKKSSVWLGWCCWLNFRVCNQSKHLFSTGFVLCSSCCVIHADWLPWNHDNRSQRSSFYAQSLILVFFCIFPPSAQWGCAYVCRRVCLCTDYMVWRGGGGRLGYPSAYLHQNDWLCCQQWLWPRFERQPYAVWLKATRPCKYYWCTFICRLHCIWKAAVCLIKQVQGLFAVAVATQRQCCPLFSIIISI